jgi:hypothetical protein
MSGKIPGGFQPFSFRVPFLRNLAKNTNPVLSYGADYLLSDKTSRRLGIIYEAVALYGLTALWLVMFYTIRKSYVAVSPEEFMAALQETQVKWPIFSTIYILLLIVGLFYGSLTAIRPLSVLFQEERESKKPDLSKYSYDGIFNSLVSLQLTSVGIPMAVSIIVLFFFGLIIEIDPAFSELPAADLAIMRNQLYVPCIQQVVWILFLTLGSIYASSIYKDQWPAFWMFILLIGICLIAYFFVFVIFVNVMGLSEIDQIRESIKFVNVIWGFLVVFVLYLLSVRKLRMKFPKQPDG